MVEEVVSNDDLHAVLWLGIPGVGAQTLQKINFFLERKKLAWEQSWLQLEQLHAIQALTQRQLEQARVYKLTCWSVSVLKQRLSELQILVISKKSARFPSWLRQVNGSPYILFCQGNTEVLPWLSSKRVAAVVGTRKITPYGKLVTKLLVDELVDEDVIIVSGGMYGVDAAAHAAALASGGTTVAVLASGLAKIGSYWQQALCEQIKMGGGLVISEFFPWQSSHKAHFPIRNRTVAGLSQVVVVTEAAEKSGSLITAQCAVDYGREVCAVPGPITSDFSDGTRWLINQGATLVGSGKEVLAAFDPDYQLALALTGGAMGEDNDGCDPIYHFLQQTGSGTTMALAKQLNLSVAELLPLLSKLELEGKICSTGSSWHLAS